MEESTVKNQIKLDLIGNKKNVLDNKWINACQNWHKTTSIQIQGNNN